VVRINSPGGAVAPSQEMYDAVRRLAAKKPVVASLGAVAASGGYYVASAADVVVASPGTLTGSIGVIMSLTNVRGLMDKLGIEPTVITAGKWKDTGSPFRRHPDERAMQKMADQVHAVHRRGGSRAGSIARARISNRRIYTGEEAQQSAWSTARAASGGQCESPGARASISNKPDRGFARGGAMVATGAALRGASAQASRARARLLSSLAGSPEAKVDGDTPQLLWRLPLVTRGFVGGHQGSEERSRCARERAAARRWEMPAMRMRCGRCGAARRTQLVLTW
jgi:signal peptide peptidase SppA